MNFTAIFENITLPQAILLTGLIIVVTWLIGYAIDLVSLVVRLIWPKRLGLDSDEIVKALNRLEQSVHDGAIDQLNYLGDIEKTLAEIRDGEPVA